MASLVISRELLLRAADLSASRDDFEVVGAFNPGAVRVANEVVLLVRVAERPRDHRLGLLGLPRWDAAAGLTVDWLPSDEWAAVDPRVVRRKSDGLLRLTFASHLRVVHCGEGRAVRDVTDVVFAPQGELEEYGVEDARITPIGDQYYFTYVAVSRHGPATALASTRDFRSFERHGVIFCPENKDVVLFPEKIGGAFAALHRPVCGSPFTRPEMWAARSSDLLQWGEHRPLAVPTVAWAGGRIGAGAPPILLPEGWLMIYHGSRPVTRTGEVGAYCAGALLLDRNDPSKVLRRTAEPFFVPEADFEVAGFVPQVVFPTGVVSTGERLLVYYGAADECTALAEFSLDQLLGALVAA